MHCRPAAPPSTRQSTHRPPSPACSSWALTRSTRYDPPYCSSPFREYNPVRSSSRPGSPPHCSQSGSSALRRRKRQQPCCSCAEPSASPSCTPRRSRSTDSPTAPRSGSSCLRSRSPSCCWLSILAMPAYPSDGLLQGLRLRATYRCGSSSLSWLRSTHRAAPHCPFPSRRTSGCCRAPCYSGNEHSPHCRTGRGRGSP